MNHVIMRRAVSLTPGVYYDESSVVVRTEVADQQLRRLGVAVEEKPLTEKAEGIEAAETGVARPKRFYGSIRLNPSRLAGDIGAIGQEIVQHLQGLLGADVEITLDIKVGVPDGIPNQVVRIVSENAKTLKFDNFGFEEE